MVMQLNALGIKAPMGGEWSLGQVQRALCKVARATAGRD